MWIIKTVIIIFAFAISVVACAGKRNGLMLNENIGLILYEGNFIPIRRERNNDLSIMERLFLTAEDVRNVQQFIKTIYPNFNFDRGEESLEEFRFRTDDVGIQLFVDNFNQNGPGFSAIWILGSETYTEYSSVQAWLNGILDTDEPRLWSYHFYFAEHFSDRSGIWFSDFPTGMRDSNTLRLWRRCGNLDDNIWEVYWQIRLQDGEIEQVFTPSEKMEMLISFLQEIRNTIVFQNIDMNWFGQIYIGIAGHRQVTIAELLWYMYIDGL